MKKLPLWQWGLLVIFASLSTNVLMRNVMSPPDPTTMQGKAALLGRAVATLTGVVAGVVLIIVHVVKKRRGRGPDAE